MAATIAAIASPAGAGLRGVLRISGDQTRCIVDASCGTPSLAARGAFEVCFDDGRGVQPALLLWMPGPRSFTREDCAELHLSGSPPLLAAALARVLALGARLAEPGEFTRRAFENGRIDLSRAEGVLALVSARNEEQRRAASALLVGGLDERVAALRDGLDDLRALCEASLDFDESDTGHVPTAELADGARAVRRGLEEASAWEARRTPPSGAPRIVLAGPPNAGKSSLFNRLTRGEALVSELAGTTRDTLTAEWNVGGSVCRLLDTAGVEEAEGEAPARAQEHARGARRRADLVLWLAPADGAGLPEEPPHDAARAARLEQGRRSGRAAGSIGSVVPRLRPQWSRARGTRAARRACARPDRRRARGSGARARPARPSSGGARGGAKRIGKRPRRARRRESARPLRGVVARGDRRPRPHPWTHDPRGCSGPHLRSLLHRQMTVSLVGADGAPKLTHNI